MRVAKKKPYIDMSKILKGLEGKWVALSLKQGQFTISGSGNSAEEAVNRASQKGEDDPILIRVPTKAMSYII